MVMKFTVLVDCSLVIMTIDLCMYIVHVQVYNGLIDCIRFSVPLKIFIHMETLPLPVKVCKLKPLSDTDSLGAGRGLDDGAHALWVLQSHLKNHSI